MRRATTLVAAIVALAAVMSSSTGGDNANERCFRSKITVERTARQVPDLARNAELDALASRHSDEMSRRGTIYHNPNLATDVPPFEYAGENVGMGPTCDSIHAAFMASRGHRENILDRDFKELGVGTVVRDGTVYVTEVFFAAAVRRPAPSPSPSCAAKGGIGP